MAAAPRELWGKLRNGRFKLSCSSSPSSEGGHDNGQELQAAKTHRQGLDSQETMAMQSPDRVPTSAVKDMPGSGSPLSPSLACWGSASAHPSPWKSQLQVTSPPMKETHTKTGKIKPKSPPELLRTKGGKSKRKDLDSPSSSCFQTPKRARAADFDASSPFYWWKFSPGYDWQSIPSYCLNKQPSPKRDTPDWSIMDTPPAAASSKGGTQQSVGREQMRVRARRRASSRWV